MQQQQRIPPQKKKQQRRNDSDNKAITHSKIVEEKLPGRRESSM